MRFAVLLLSSFLTSAYCSAAEYPSHKGYVNDFADQLAPGDQQALEGRLRAFERKTSIEVAVAIVPSLEEESVETYANGLFRFWGVGKKDKNNGVLFLWAPSEHKVRIVVGYGLESSISSATAAEILRETTALFRQQQFARGVQSAVDGILGRLDGPGAGAPQFGEDPGSNRTGLWLASALAVGVLAAAIVLIGRRRTRMRQLQAEVPQQLKGLDGAIAEAEAGLKQAAANLETLKRESPAEVWAEVSESLTTAPANLAKLRESAVAIRRQPIQEYSELRAASRSLHQWHHRLSSECSAFANAGATLEHYRFRRNEAEKLLGSLGDSLAEFSARYAAGELPGRAETLLPAARETHSRALSLAAANPANWFLVYDLLTDVQECLDRIQNSYQWSRRPRCWSGSDVDSPAVEAMAVLFATWTSVRDSPLVASDYGGDGGGGSSSSDSGGGGDFGGGDTGGAGSSDSY